MYGSPKVSLVRLYGVIHSLKGYDPSTSIILVRIQMNQSHSHQFKSLPGNYSCNYYIIASLLK